MDSTVSVKYVAGKQRPFVANGKNFIDYGIKIEGSEDWYSFVQFANQPAPQQGDTITEAQEIDKGQYSNQIRGKIVRAVSQAVNNGSAPLSTPSNERNDSRQVSIVRQHSQEMAVRWAVANGITTLTDLRELIEWFEKDAWGDTPDAPTAIARTANEERSPDDIPF